METLINLSGSLAITIIINPITERGRRITAQVSTWPDLYTYLRLKVGEV